MTTNDIAQLVDSMLSLVFENIWIRSVANSNEDTVKGLNAQHALLALLENWRTALDRKGFGGAILAVLSKGIGHLK